MKLIVLLIIILCLFLIYRLCFPKRIEKQAEGTTPKVGADEADAVGKSLFVLPPRSQARTTPATPEKTLVPDEKQYTFAPEIQKRTAVVPPEDFDKVFGKMPEPEAAEVDERDLDIDKDEDDMPDVDLAEEDEELRQVMNGSAVYAGGYTIDEMEEAVKTADRPESEQSPQVIETLYELSKTDMFEQLVSGDTGKAARINAVLDRYEQSIAAEETGSKEDDSEYGNFDIRQFLS